MSICDWDGLADDVRFSKGEYLCGECRASVALREILSAVE